MDHSLCGIRAVPGMKSEIDLGRLVISWLTDLGWEVYQEVQLFSQGHIADIVAVKKPLVWILECKNSLTLAVIEQADGWRDYANYLSIVVPQMSWSRRVAGRSMAFHLLNMLGIGVLEAHDNTWGGPQVQEKVQPRLRRRVSSQLFGILTEDHKTFAEAGNPDGKRLTPFTMTCLRVADEMKKQERRSKKL